MTDLDPGRMDRSVQLLRPVASKDAAGGPVTAWEVGLEWRASVRGAGTRQGQGGGERFEPMLSFVGRRLPAGTFDAATWRIRHEGEDYEPVAVEPFGERLTHRIRVLARRIDPQP